VQQPRVGPTSTVYGEVDPGAVLEVSISAVPVEEQHAALVPALVLSAQEVDAQRGAFLDPHATCAPRSGTVATAAGAGTAMSPG